MNRALAVVVVGASLALAGCGASSSDTGPLPNGGAISASNPVVVTPTPAAWPQITDRRSGVRFDFPHRKKPVVKSHGTSSTWTYQMPVPGGDSNGDKLTVAMAFFDGPVPGLSATLDQLATASKQAGITDTAKSALRTTHFAAGAGQTGTLSFTDPTGQKGLWMITEFAVGKFTVTAQVYSQSDASELVARKRQVKQLMHQLLGSIRLS